MTDLSRNPTTDANPSPRPRFWHNLDLGMLVLLFIVGSFLGLTAVLGKVAINTAGRRQYILPTPQWGAGF